MKSLANLQNFSIFATYRRFSKYAETEMSVVLHQTNDFSLQNAIHLANLAAWSYQKDETLLWQGLQKIGYSYHVFLHEAKEKACDTDVLLVANEECFVICFQATEEESIKDWLNDLDNRTWAYGLGNVRKGFWEATELIWEKLLQEIYFHYKPTQHLWLTGHSQGGALALLTARRLFDEKFNIQGVYTFGQPKVGDLLFAVSYDNILKNRTYRIYNEEDTVVKNPPNLYHCGTGVKLKKDGLVEVEYFGNIFETAEITFSSILDMLWECSLDSLEAHSIKEYVKRLQDAKY